MLYHLEICQNIHAIRQHIRTQIQHHFTFSYHTLVIVYTLYRRIISQLFNAICYSQSDIIIQLLHHHRQSLSSTVIVTIIRTITFNLLLVILTSSILVFVPGGKGTTTFRSDSCCVQTYLSVFPPLPTAANHINNVIR